MTDRRRRAGGSPARRPRSAPRSGARPAAAAGAAALLLVSASCSPGGGAGGGGAGPTLTVFAAASLTGVFEGLAADFEEETGARVEFSFAGSSDLARQITDGAPADVFASADTATMDQAVDSGSVAGEPETFARNILQIAVPPDNPAGIEDFGDLAEDGTAVAVCAEEVPCGAAARELMGATGVQVQAATEEEDVKAALTKASLGEVDAALVYATDVNAAGGDVEGIGIDGAEEAANDYPIAPLASAADAELAERWVQLVLSETGQDALAEAGFLPAGSA
ncbi:molybdate ABC transporter substrate-binding protein [Nocardiopsis coralliicola]